MDWSYSNFGNLSTAGKRKQKAKSKKLRVDTTLIGREQDT